MVFRQNLDSHAITIQIYSLWSKLFNRNPFFKVEKGPFKHHKSDSTGSTPVQQWNVPLRNKFFYLGKYALIDTHCEKVLPLHRMNTFAVQKFCLPEVIVLIWDKMSGDGETGSSEVKVGRDLSSGDCDSKCHGHSDCDSDCVSDSECCLHCCCNCQLQVYLES